MLEKVKIALRISHSKLDSDINDSIAAAKAELNRLGIHDDYTKEPADPLIIRAIKTYCLSIYSSDQKAREGYEKSFLYILDCLSKTSKYKEGISNV